MKLYSTNKKSPIVGLREVVLSGLAPDGGLYLPTELPKFPKEFFNQPNLSFAELAGEVAVQLLGEDVPKSVLAKIVPESFNFSVPLIELFPGCSVLELFHGPTLAFKDFAARFMARLLAYFIADSNRELTMLVATSGDTGSAVAAGFFNVPGIRVAILYPKDGVSYAQEKQLTTWGGNITALEVDGTFDDCQRLLKQALLDSQIKRTTDIATANSINIARLLPQSFYYCYAYAQLANHDLPTVISVPSGNFGNLTAGLIAKKMGLPVSTFIAATNANRVVPEYLASGNYSPRPSIHTISNAMDVGTPSNFERMRELYSNDVEKLRGDVAGFGFSDEETKKCMQQVYAQYHYMLDPHGAVGYLGLTRYQKQFGRPSNGIFLETAHPAKFQNVVEEVFGEKIPLPAALSECMKKEKMAVALPNSFVALKEYLI